MCTHLDIRVPADLRMVSVDLDTHSLLAALTFGQVGLRDLMTDSLLVNDLVSMLLIRILNSVLTNLALQDHVLAGVVVTGGDRLANVGGLELPRCLHGEVAVGEGFFGEAFHDAVGSGVVEVCDVGVGAVEVRRSRVGSGDVVERRED